MAFKLNNPPYVATAPVHEIDMEDGVLGKADRNGNILINNKIKDPKQRQEVVDHEQIILMILSLDYYITMMKMYIAVNQ